MIAATIYCPTYRLDLRTVRIDATGDWRTEDAAAIMLEGRVLAETLALYELALRPPTIVYASGAAALRVIAARFRLAGFPSRFVESDYTPTEARDAFTELRSGRLNVLVTRRAFTGGPQIADVAIVLARPTRLAEPFLTFLGRLQAPVRVIDLAGNCERCGVPADWEPEFVTSAPVDVVCDPIMARLSTMTMAQLQRWAEGDRARLTLVALAKDYKSPWIEHSVEGWADAQIRNRSRPSPDEDRRPQRRSNARKAATA